MTYRKKLIEVALPLEAINEASAREKSIRHGHPSTLHLWWARRPLAACRAIIFASLVDDPDDPEAPPEFVAACRKLPRGRNAADHDTPRQRLFDFIETLVRWESTTDEKVLGKARELIRLATDGNPPPLLDPFAGGGSIPLEAQRLGLEAHASDLNPVAVMINKALIEIPPKFANMPPVNPRDRQKMGSADGWKGAAGLAADVRYYGQWMRDKAWERIGHLYPAYIGRRSAQINADDDNDEKISVSQRSSASGAKGETVIAWLWARTVKCPNPACGAMMPLVRSFELSKKKGRRAWIEPKVDPKSRKISFEVKTGSGKAPEGTVDRRGATCLACNTAVPFDHIRNEGKAGRMSAQMMAIVTEGSSGRSYYAPSLEHEQTANVPIPDNAPITDLPEQALSFRVQLYGMTKHRDLFTPRQLTALTTFSDLVAEVRQQIEEDARAAWRDVPPPQPSPAGGGSQNPSPQRGEVGRGADLQRSEVGRRADLQQDEAGRAENNLWIPLPVPPKLLEAARQLRRDMTDAELLLWQCLRRKQLGGFRFRKQHPIERFVLDFYCPKTRLAIELDGGQHNTAEGIASDEERTAILEQHGIKVMRFWNNDVLTNLEGVLQKIYQTLQERDAPPPPSPPPPQPSPAGGGSQNSSPQRGEVGRGADIQRDEAGKVADTQQEKIEREVERRASSTPLRDDGVGVKAYAEAVSVYLAFAVDRSADFWASLAFWANQPKNELVAHVFGRQALPMVWDFAEANPFSSSGGNWLGNLEYIAKGIDKSVSNPTIGKAFHLIFARFGANRGGFYSM